MNPFPYFPQFHCLCSEDYFLRREKQQKHFLHLFSSQRKLIRILAITPMFKCNFCQINDESTSQQFRVLQLGPHEDFFRVCGDGSPQLTLPWGKAKPGKFKRKQKLTEEITLQHSFQGPAKNHKRILNVLGKLLPAEIPTASIQLCCYAGRGWKSQQRGVTS